MGENLREQLSTKTTYQTESGLSTESGPLTVKNILEESDTLSLAEIIEKQYNLKMFIQPITNINREIVKQEWLLRSENELNPEIIVENIRNNEDSHALVCYLLKQGYETFRLNNTPCSINLEISDMMHPNFLNAVNIYSNQYKDISDKNVTFEILEREVLPVDTDERKEFFQICKKLRSKWFKIALDDIWARDNNGKLLYSNRDRIDEFIKEGALDIVKLDMEVVRELYLAGGENVVSFIWEYLKTLKNIAIVAEWIEWEFWRTVDWAREKYADNIDVDDFMKFLEDKLWVTHFQWYALWKPHQPKSLSL